MVSLFRYVSSMFDDNGKTAKRRKPKNTALRTNYPISDSDLDHFSAPKSEPEQPEAADVDDDHIRIRLNLNDGNIEVDPAVGQIQTAVIFGLAATSLAVAGYGATKSVQSVKTYMHDKWAIPSIVKETSITSVYEWLSKPVVTAKNAKKRNESKNTLDRFLWTENTQSKCSTITQYARAAAKNPKIPFKNVLVYGPPGNGKSSFVKKLAMNSGIDYAVVDGKDLSSYGNNATAETLKLFEWIDKRREKPTMLIVEKSEKFLGKQTDKHLRGAADVFVGRIACQPESLMLLLTANNLLETSIVDRMNDFVAVPFPDRQLRQTMIEHYSNMYLNGYDDNYRSDLEKLYDQVVKNTEKMPLHEIEKLVKSWACKYKPNQQQDGAENEINPSYILDCCKHAADQYQKKMQWMGAQPFADFLPNETGDDPNMLRTKL